MISTSKSEPQNGIIIYSFISPKGLIGQVTLGLFDSKYSNAPVFSLGYYGFEAPAEVLSIMPNTWTFASDLDVLVFGTGFKDSALFSCVIGEYFIPARWMSDTMAVCSLSSLSSHSTATSGFNPMSSLFSPLFPSSSSYPSNGLSSQFSTNIPSLFQYLQASVSLERITLKISNNGFDSFGVPAFITVKTNIDSITVFPLKGFTSGGTPVAITVTGNIFGSIYCRFGTNRAIQAFKTDSSHLFCISPLSVPGIVDLSVFDESGVTLFSGVYEYFSVPQLSSFSPSVLQVGLASLVMFEGSGFDSSIGR